MKKLLSILLVCLLVPVSLAFVGCSKPEDDENKVWRDMAVELPDYELVEVEDGKFAKMIEISTAEELAGLAKEVNNGEKFTDYIITLEADIDLKNILWDPIGYGAIDKETGRELGRTFAGIFDGKDHTISNLYVRATKGGEDGGSGGVGLFGCVSGTVKNLKIVNADVEGNHWVGAAVGYMLHVSHNMASYKNGSIVCEEFRALTPQGGIDNVHVENVKVNCVYLNASDSGDKVGALVGFIYESYVTNCSAKDSIVSAGRDAGQLIGCVTAASTIDLSSGTPVGVNWDYQTGNTAENVDVSWNESGESTGSNIKNELVGRK